jgi:hypothetical protein
VDTLRRHADGVVVAHGAAVARLLAAELDEAADDAEIESPDSGAILEGAAGAD